MRFKKFSVYLMAVFTSLSLFPQSIDLYYTSSLNGNLDGCDCRAVPRAGIVRTAPFIRQRSSASLFFDLGDSFDVYPDEELHLAIQHSFLSLELDCSALGDQEFIEGVDWVKNNDFPYLANNISIDDKNFSYRHKSFAVDGFSVAVGAVIDPGVFYFSPDKIRKRIAVFDPVVSARSLLQAMETEDAHLKVLLYHGPLDKAQDIMKLQHGWDVVLVGHEQRLEAEITSGSPRFIGSPGDNGNRVGVLSINFLDGMIASMEHSFFYFSYWDDPKDSYIDSLLESYRRSMLERLR